MTVRSSLQRCLSPVLLALMIVASLGHICAHADVHAAVQPAHGDPHERESNRGDACDAALSQITRDASAAMRSSHSRPRSSSHRAISDGLPRNYPESAATFRKNAEGDNAKLDEAIARWTREAVLLKGKKLVELSPGHDLFREAVGMEQFGTIEMRAGIDPTPSHVADLIERMKRERVDIVVRERHYPRGSRRRSRARRAPDWSRCRR